MKKIIYSLVIMIAAGSLFTSCIEQVEPDGILALREAKARYYDALSKLREADAEYRRAEAGVQQAEAALKQAQAAHQQAVTDAYTKMQALERELKELEIAEKTMEMELRAAEIAQEIDRIQKEMELAEKQHEIDLVNKEAELAQAQEALRVTLRDIALAAQDLTANEKQAVIAAAELYLQIWEQAKDQEIAVMKAEKALADAKRAKEIGKYNDDYAWDSETHAYQAKIDLYQRAIDRAKANIEKDKVALENVPTLPDVDAWQAELETYQEIADAAEYSRHKLTQEAAAYYVQYVHDGVKAYNDEIEAWEKKNPAKASAGKEPTFTEGQTKYTLLNDVPKDKIDDKAHKAGETFGAASTEAVELPTLEIGTGAAFVKFTYILDKLANLDSPAEEGKKILGTTGKYEVSANQDMKDFILGDEMGDVETQKFTYKKEDGTEVELVADYGLYGAVSVLLRDKVLNPDVPADPEKAREAADKAKDAWQADHDTLAAGLLAYEPYTTAVAELDAAKVDEKTNGDKMVNAVAELMEALASVNNLGISKNDSVAVINGLAKFAAAREDYFKYTWNPETDKFDRHYYWFGNTIGDTLKVTWRTLDYAQLLSNDKFGVTLETQKKFADPATDKEDALGHMVYQMINSTFGDVIKNTNPKWDFSSADINGDGCKAFFYDYKYVPAADPVPAHFELNDGSGTWFVSSTITDAQDKVTAAIEAYKACYERYWNETWPADGTVDYSMDADAVKAALEANPDTNIDSYTLGTFTEPFIIPNAWESANVPTGINALGAILGSVDKAATDTKATNLTFFGGSDESVVFGTAADPTDINDYLYKEYLYQLALNPAAGDIKKIQDWVDKVAAAFGPAEEAAAALAKKAYEADHAVWQSNKDGYDKYQTALKEFTGTDSKGNALGIRKITGSYPDVASIQYKFELVDVVGGKWISKLKGTQLELANKYFPEFPEKLNDWYVRNEDIDDTIAHSNILIDALKPAYYAACKAAGYADAFEAADYDELIENYEAYRKAYIKALKNDIAAQTQTIDDYSKLIADFESGAAQADIDIAEAQAKLDKENKKMTVLNELLKGAKENLDRILQYLLSTDANFVIPTGIDLGSIK